MIVEEGHAAMVCVSLPAQEWHHFVIRLLIVEEGHAAMVNASLPAAYGGTPNANVTIKIVKDSFLRLQ